MSHGKNGALPDWFATIRAAKILGVPPWEMEEAPECWFYRALAYERIEVKVEDEFRKRAMEKAKAEARR